MARQIIDPVQVVGMYRDGHSPYAIAEHFNTYANRIRRMLEKAGEKMRSKGEAQSNAIKTGRSEHPTEGKKRSHEEKLAISASVVRHWKDMDQDEKERRREQSREAWASMDLKKREEMRAKAAEEIRKAARQGSKLEKEVQKMLAGAGIRYESHKKDLNFTKKLEVDIYIPSYSTIIEVDGLSHFEPIWGDEQLQKQIKADNEKEGLVLTKGFNVIRIENLSGSMAIAKLADLQEKVLAVLKEIKDGNITSTLKVIKYE